MEEEVHGSWSKLRELRQLREENSKLKRPLADLSRERHVLQKIVRKQLKGLGRGGVGAAGPRDEPAGGSDADSGEGVNHFV